ncbi:PEP-CTERM sorting domain-containing protein [Pelomonas sp. KK5]|uniref:PEP-CTERM sorting domain-containing protein n=1 Tax=Pelomonas sp. KK5 TaxID=1855730 RepID=UPI001180C575|nr:PEP-CTERM sorting domain-containing protein [Pelomonas sp. KK5]
MSATSRLLLPVVALLCSLAGTASGQTQASVTLNAFNFSVNDLDGEDGVAAGLTWDTSPTLTIYSNEQQQRGWVRDTDNPNYVVGDWNTSTDSAMWGVLPRLSVSSPLGMGRANADADGSMSASMAVVSGFSGRQMVEFSRAFTLSPNTVVTFSYVVDGAASGPGSDGSWPLTDGYPATNKSDAIILAQMSAGPSFFLLNDGGDTFWEDVSDPYASAIADRTITLTLRNPDSVARSYLLDVTAGVLVSDVLAPVPEPGGHALMALGLAAVGAAVKRRRA